MLLKKKILGIFLFCWGKGKGLHAEVHILASSVPLLRGHSPVLTPLVCYVCPLTPSTTVSTWVTTLLRLMEEMTLFAVHFLPQLSCDPIGQWLALITTNTLRNGCPRFRSRLGLSVLLTERVQSDVFLLQTLLFTSFSVVYAELSVIVNIVCLDSVGSL